MMVRRGLRGSIVRSQELRATQRQQILAAAGRVFARKGYAQGTMEDIATELGGSKGILYYQFESKQDIIVETRRQASGGAADRLAEIVAKSLPVRDRLELAIRDLVAASFDELSRHVILTPADKGLDEAHARQVREIERRYETLLLKLLEEGVAGNVVGDVSPRLAMLTIIRVGMAPATWGKRPDRLSQDAICDQLTKLLLQGVLAT